MHQRLIVNAMEPRAIMAEWDGDRMVVHIGSQNPSATRDILCDVILKMPKDKVRVLVRDIGGGFGMRTGIQPDESVAVWVAKVLKRPVKWRAERSEEFASATAGRDQLHKMALALDKDGRILALRMEAFANVGAYPSGAGIAIPLFVGPKVVDRHLRRPAGRLQDHLRADQHRDDRRLSRRRAGRNACSISSA